MHRTLLTSAAALGLITTAHAAETIIYSYDVRGQLVAVRHSGSVNSGIQTSYQFDKANNRVGKTVSGVSISTISGTEGAETLQGTPGHDLIQSLGGNDVIYAQQGGDDRVEGGEGNDGIYFGAAFTSADSIDGGGGSDQIAIQGFYPNLVFGPSQLTGVESFVALPNTDTRFGGAGPNPFTYSIVTVDENVPAGGMLTIYGVQLTSSEMFTVDGRAETNGTLRLWSGAANDLLFGGSGPNHFAGRGGADRLVAGTGADQFLYLAGDSCGALYDTLVGFDERTDKIDLPGTITGFGSAVTNANLSSSSFEADLVAAAQANLGPQQALVVQATSGTLAGKTFLVMDANEVAGFTPGTDFVVELEAPAVPISGSASIFM